MPHSFRFGRWHRDGKTGKWTKKKVNRKKDWWEFEGRTKAQRARDRKARQARSEALGQARTEKAGAKKRERFEKARVKAEGDQAFRDRAEARHAQEPQPQPKVTVTKVGTWGQHAGAEKGTAGSRVVRGEVLGSRTQTALPAAARCGQKTADGTPCQRLGTCPPGTHRAKAAAKKAAPKRQSAGKR